MFMKKIPLTKGAFAVVDDDMFDSLSQHHWFLSSNGYAMRNCAIGNGKYSAMCMHRQILNLEKGDKKDVDHINMDHLDNRKENLRICTRSENMRNRGKNKNNKSGYKGVSWFARDSKWVAGIKHNGKRKYLGLFDDPALAHEAYKKVALELHGEFAKME